MIDYTGYKCKSCGNAFKHEDDIVVCPDCGTPYHRECWKKEGHCINNDYHLSGKSWQVEAEKQIEAAAEHCGSCGHTLKDEQLFCDKCGAPTPYFIRTQQHNSTAAPYSSSTDELYRKKTMGEQVYPPHLNYADPIYGINPTEEYGEGVTASELGYFVKTNTHYYLPKFKFMKDTNMRLVPNFAAMLFPELYFSYRKMPLMALAVIILKCICSVPDIIMNVQKNSAEITEMLAALVPSAADILHVENLLAVNISSDSFMFVRMVCTGISWALVLILGFFSNYLYMRHAIKKTAKLKRTAAAQCISAEKLICLEGGTSLAVMFAFLAIYFILFYVTFFALLFFV